MYLSLGQIILLAIVFFLFFGNFDKLNKMFIDFKSSLNKDDTTKKKKDNLNFKLELSNLKHQLINSPFGYF